MKSILATILCLFIIGCSHPNKSNSPTQKDIIKHIEGSSVALVVRIDDKFRPYCSGVWVSETQILTANHCIDAIAKRTQPKEDEEAVDVHSINFYFLNANEAGQVNEEPNAVHLGKVKNGGAIDELHDLAIITAMGVAIPKHDIAKLADNAPEVGDNVHIIGMPQGLYFSYVRGTVSAIRQSMPLRHGKIIQISAPVWFGNSGGGAFNESGELIGIASFMAKAPNTAFFVHANVIRLLLDENKL